MSERWADPYIAAFFRELDRRIAGGAAPHPGETPVESRAFLATARPVLERFADEEPERFMAIVAEFFARREA